MGGGMAVSQTRSTKSQRLAEAAAFHRSRQPRSSFAANRIRTHHLRPVLRGKHPGWRLHSVGGGERWQGCTAPVAQVSWCCVGGRYSLMNVCTFVWTDVQLQKEANSGGQIAGLGETHRRAQRAGRERRG